jgi:hypothetical protein
VATWINYKIMNEAISLLKKSCKGKWELNALEPQNLLAKTLAMWSSPSPAATGGDNRNSRFSPCTKLQDRLREASINLSYTSGWSYMAPKQRLANFYVGEPSELGWP